MKIKSLLAMSVFIAFASSAQTSADTLLLSHYHPHSIYKTPEANIQKASAPAIDMHSHDYADGEKGVDDWVKLMDKKGIAKTMILSYQSGKGFDSVVEKYKRYTDRFTIWCGFDYTGYGTPGWEKHAVAELERCYKMGARGVGEIGDKGTGDLYSKPASGKGLHIDDPQMKPLLQKCAELHIPVSVHVAEDEWMYEMPDSANDGLMNGATWHVDMNEPNKLGHDELIKTLENAVRDNPKTTFVACHLANTCSNLAMLGNLLDKYPNLYADIAARYGEIAPIPRYAAAFITRYADRIVYGTDMSPANEVYLATFRILESDDEHFYYPDLFNYHWALYGLHLSKDVLEKVYRKNAERIMSGR